MIERRNIKQKEQAKSFTPRKACTQRRKVKVRAEQGYVRTQPQTAQTGALPGFKYRSILLLFVMCLGFSLLGGQLGQVALSPAIEPRISIRDLPTQTPKRGNIYDRNGTLLATSVEVFSVYADPKRVPDVQATSQALAKILELNTKEIHKKLENPKRRFVWLQRQITPAQAFTINALGLPGIGFRTEQVRLYPGEQLAAHVLGGVTVDNTGLSGIERGFQNKLAEGEDIHLTLDSRLQQQLEDVLIEGHKNHNAKGTWGVVLDAQDGDILAMASLPNFNPNHPGDSPAKNRFNPLTFGRYEMGSTFKLFALAQGLESGTIELSTPIDCRKPLKIDSFTINDFHAKRRVLSALEVMRYSSNIGAATIADKVGPEHQQAFFGNLGLLDELNVGLPETISPLYPNHWGRVHTMTMSYGHGIAVTPIQLAAAVATLSTNGYYKHPRLLQTQVTMPPTKAVDDKILADVKTLMRDVVYHGSGRSAQITGLDIGGKTGTAEKVTAKGYSDKKNLVSFVGAVPLDDPKYVILVMVDEPQKPKDSHPAWQATGGWVAAPMFKQVVQRVAALGTLPTAEPNVILSRSGATENPNLIYTGKGEPQHAALKPMVYRR